MVAIILHLYYQDLWEEFKSKIIPLLNDDIHLYITVNRDSEHIKDMEIYAKEVYLLKNKGTDFGPFVYSWNKIKDNGYKYILKLHGKKSEAINIKYGLNIGDSWREELVDCIISSTEKFDNILEFMKINENIFMAGSQKHFYEREREPIDHVNRINCSSSVNKLLKYVDSSDHGCFIGGSVFIVTTNYLNKFFGNCDLNDLYDEFEEYYSSEGELLSHAMERVIGYGVEKHNGKFLILEND